MRRVAIALALCFIASTARASPVMYVGGTGPPNVLPAHPDVGWSEPPDLNGLIASSEQILAFGLESELANDFYVNGGGVVHVTFWGGYYSNSTPCSSGITTPGFNLKFYDDGGCVPGNLVAHVVATTFGETSVGCQSGVYPMFKWDMDVAVWLTDGLYWFGGQIRDHAFPPQGGRLAAGQVTGCDTVFQSVYFGFPDWTPAIDVFGVAFDASQEFVEIGPITGACCIGQECRDVDENTCNDLGGNFHGYHTVCNPSTCLPVPTRSTSWGKIKTSYR